jgi:hypothetical protein
MSTMSGLAMTSRRTPLIVSDTFCIISPFCPLPSAVRARFNHIAKLKTVKHTQPILILWNSQRAALLLRMQWRNSHWATAL